MTDPALGLIERLRNTMDGDAHEAADEIERLWHDLDRARATANELAEQVELLRYSLAQVIELARHTGP